MPIIRGSSAMATAAKVLTTERRQQLLKQLSAELSGSATEKGPVIFEIPLEQSDKMDVLVVWEAWAALRSEDRTSMILEAYAGQQDKIAQALGVTYEEATEQQVLPYAVLPMVHRGECNAEDLKKAMIDEGAIALENGSVELRFPTFALAENAHLRLCDKLPKGYWSIASTVARIF